jgi:hypothetical protein
LLALAWWNWPDEKIKEEVPFLMSLKIGDFIARHKRSSSAAADHTLTPP